MQKSQITLIWFGLNWIWNWNWFIKSIPTIPRTAVCIDDLPFNQTPSLLRGKNGQATRKSPLLPRQSSQLKSFAHLIRLPSSNFSASGEDFRVHRKSFSSSSLTAFATATAAAASLDSSSYFQTTQKIFHLPGPLGPQVTFQFYSSKWRIAC